MLLCSRPHQGLYSTEDLRNAPANIVDEIRKSNAHAWQKAPKLLQMAALDVHRKQNPSRMQAVYDCLKYMEGGQLNLKGLGLGPDNYEVLNNLDYKFGKNVFFPLSDREFQGGFAGNADAFISDVAWLLRLATEYSSTIAENSSVQLTVRHRVQSQRCVCTLR